MRDASTHTIMIKSIFYSHFHPGKGPQVVYQVPDNSITPLLPCTSSSFSSSSPPHHSGPHPHSHSPHSQPLFDFDTISAHIIPKQELCDRLVTVCTGSYRILGYPVCLSDRKYARNEFIFNFAIVVDADVEYCTYKSVVRKVAKLFKALEEQSGFLSNEVTRAGVYALIEQVMEDLNNYSECMIPINESNTLNLKLFPTYAPPPPVRAYHVPLLTVQLDTLMDVNWDLTLQRIAPHIDGINSVRRLADLADTDYTLARKAIEHLLYYGCLVLVDVFQFGAIYACTAEIASFAADRCAQEECAAYVSTSGSRVPLTRLLEMYTSLCQGTTLRKWCVENVERLRGVDVRRFVSFGVVKGFLYRSHRWPVAADPDRLGGKVKRWVEGGCCVDEICTELGMGEREVVDLLEGVGADIVNR